ncbi:hypothetical protein MMC34_005845 [Xylographa carneopallida]|nr:hypothetical protein [Xylographa carneopallida]
MQLPTTSTLLLFSLTLTARTAFAIYDDDYHYGLQARDLYARSAAAEVYNDIMGLAPRDADPEADDYLPGLYRRHETLQECYSECTKDSPKGKGANMNILYKCRRGCAEQYPGHAGTIGRG